MDGRRTGPPQGTREQDPAYRPARPPRFPGPAPGGRGAACDRREWSRRFSGFLNPARRVTAQRRPQGSTYRPPSSHTRPASVASRRGQGIACQGDGTTSLSRGWDHLEVSVSITGLALGVNGGAPGGAASLPVGGAFDDEGVRAGGEPVCRRRTGRAARRWSWSATQPAPGWRSRSWRFRGVVRLRSRTTDAHDPAQLAGSGAGRAAGCGALTF